MERTHQPYGLHVRTGRTDWTYAPAVRTSRTHTTYAHDVRARERRRADSPLTGPPALDRARGPDPG
ncbi:hypothetical protein J2Z21_000063 [Streptomyces griseochromogenes]|uniref:Uncharacterized protein n=1 Tax=Streptomyces griseochromogenes TaxID=68214 RepID=A0ABS4LIC1_9ACTN|nr:hypothetical protein [Streptomyces griseochromogenes]